ncbi:MAG: hypothetical protein ACP5UT_16765 [Bryobacteraceae bacterium]
MSRPKLEMKLGAEPKKVAILVALLAVAAYFFYQNSSQGTPSPPPAARPRPAARGSTPEAESRTPAAPRMPEGRREFRPSLVPPKGMDTARVDPALRLDLLERLEKARFEGVGRNLFEFGPVEAPRPKLPEPKIQLQPQAKMIGPEPPPPPPAPPAKQPPPPIPLKFYGVALPLRGNDRRVFCLQGDEILTPSEGDLIQNRYRIVRITATSVLVEDTQYRHQQQIPVDQPPPGG